ncbi:MAG: hypothetical protein ACOWWM_14635 [Desulfobacterales bacterium]
MGITVSNGGGIYKGKSGISSFNAIGIELINFIGTAGSSLLVVLVDGPSE